MTRHHLFPRRHYGTGRKNDKLIVLCCACHDEIERIIPFGKMPDEFYLTTTAKFLNLAESFL